MDIPSIGKLKPRKSYVFLAFFVLLFFVSDIAYANTVTATIPVGASPRYVAVDNDSNLIYVTNSNDDSVSVINGATNMVTATIPVGNRPLGIAVDTDDNLIYVANLNVSFDTDDDTVSVINGATNMVSATIPVNVLTGIAVDVDSNLIYVASRQSDTVSVIDGVINTVTKVITLGTGVVGVAVDSGDNLIYVTDRFDNVVYVIDNNPLPSTGNGNGDSRHKTAPTSGLDWNTFKQIVEGGFTVNGKSIDIIDNWHTDFEKQKISIGKINSFGIKTYAQNNGLLFQEISFGIPKVGEYQNAEVIITVWYNHDKSIKDVTIEQDRYIIDSSSLQVLTSQIPCGYIDSTCYQTDIYAIFNEPLQYDVFAIKAVDMSRRSMMPTYLNEGFDISGHSLNPMQTKQIPGPEKYEGLITVTQLERFSDLWKTEDGRIFEMWGESNSFKLVYQPSEDKSQDTGSIKDRDHSSFYNWKQLQIDKAQEYFDSGIIQNGFPSSFTYYFEFDETLFDVEYTATNMAVSGIEADLDFISLILTVDIIDSPGTLDITFERYFFDSVYQGLDDDFIVLADGNKPNYTETETTTQSRTLSIELPAGTEEVEIIGLHLETFQLPEDDPKYITKVPSFAIGFGCKSF